MANEEANEGVRVAVAMDAVVARLLREGFKGDVYRQAASEVLGVPVDAVTDAQRQAVKVASFASRYGRVFEMGGERYEVSEPVEVGKIPMRSEIQILPNTERIAWVCQTYDGCEVYRFGEDGQVVEVPLTAREDVQEGMELAVVSITGGYYRMTVERHEGTGEWVARAGQHLSAVLRWDIDDRHCWTVSDLVNTRGLERLEIQR